MVAPMSDSDSGGRVYIATRATVTARMLHNALGLMLEDGLAADAPVLFDTEAARFNVHMVEINSVAHHCEPVEHVALATLESRQHGYADDADRAKMTPNQREWQELREKIADKFEALISTMHGLFDGDTGPTIGNVSAVKMVQTIGALAIALSLGEPSPETLKRVRAVVAGVVVPS
jgi:hypothetical protein